MDRLAHPATPRTSFTTPAPGLEQMPQEVLQHILHYLPIKGARNVFRLLSRGYLSSTDYLRIAGLVRARIRSMAVEETQAQALQRYTVLIHDCMDQRLPAGTTSSLFMELVDLLPALPTADLPMATRMVLASTKTLGERPGYDVRERCMERCIATYQQRSETEAQLPGFEPADDEEAALAARHFFYDLDRILASTEQMLSHMENLCSALGWAEKVADADERVRLLCRMCRHGMNTFIMFNLMDEEFRQRGALPRAQALRNKLAQTAMRMLPAQPIQAQAALISLALEVSAKDQDAYRLAVQAARRLLRQAPDDTLLAHWKTISKALYRGGVVKALTQRACAWPDLKQRATMLSQLASAAYDKADFGEMDRLCVMVNALVPPDMDALGELIDRHANTVGQARVEFIVRELIPSLIALPARQRKVDIVLFASRFIFAPYKQDPGLVGERQLHHELSLCLAYYKKLIAATFVTSAADPEPMRVSLVTLAGLLKKDAHAFRCDYKAGARATMKSELIALIGSLADQFSTISKSDIRAYEIFNAPRVMAGPASLEQVPHELLQKILDYLPVKPTRDAFRLINRKYRASTAYLHSVGMLQTRIEKKIGVESEQQADKRLVGLVTDCLSSTFPMPLRHSMIMALVDTLPQLPASDHARALRAVLALRGMIGEHAGLATRRECMVRGIHAFQRRFEQETQMEALNLVNDEEIRIAVDYFTEIDPTTMPLRQVIRHLENLSFALCWADAMDDKEESERAVVFLYEHYIDTHALLDGMSFHLKQGKAWTYLVQSKADFTKPALLMLPLRSPAIQAVLVSLVLSLTEPHSAMYRQAEDDGLALIAETSDAMLPVQLGWLANSLFHGKLADALIERVTSWPEPSLRLMMLRQLATVAWEKGKMRPMETLCAAICRLDPPDPAEMEALMEANRHKDAAARLDISTRDLIPYLLFMPPGPSVTATVRNAALFGAGLASMDMGHKEQMRSNALYAYALDACMRLNRVHGISMQNALERGTNTHSAASNQNSAAAFTAAATELLNQPPVAAMMQTLEQLLKQLMKKPGE